jgi:response regulator RpfG family c-di-GMP phosphodiesterase
VYVPISVRPAAPSSSKKVVEHLLREKLISPDEHAAAVEQMRQTGDRFEEVVIDLGFVSEADLLKALATLYRTNFVSTERLAKLEVPRSTLALIPQKFAEQALIFPVVFDAKTLSLSIVSVEPDDTEMLREVQLAADVRDVKAFLARPSAIKAVIRKAYGGDAHAFAALERAAIAQIQTLHRVNELSFGPDLSKPPTRGKAVAAAERAQIADLLQLSDPPPRPAQAPPPAPLKAPKIAPALTVSTPQSLRTVAATAQAVQAEKAASSENFLELLNVLVSLLEQSRAELRGHSAQVARLMRRVAERISLDAPTTTALVAAAYVHDLGKLGQYHLTSLNAGEYDGHRAAAQKSFSIPARLVEAVKLPSETIAAVNGMYERYDGRGFPDGASGKEIPLGARVLAVCDTYADLTENARNPYRKKLTAEEACAVLAKYKEKYFDPNLVDLFRHMVMGEGIRQRLLANRYTALIIDTDPEETTVVELRMIEQGFVVKTARTAEQAVQALAEGGLDLVVSEVDLAGSDGLALLADARKTEKGKNLPWVIYTRRQERAEAQKALALGALDYVTKPAATDVLVARLKAMLDQRASSTSSKESRGVSGSLQEMSLPDMIQVLSQARKSGALRIRSGGESGQVDFAEGNVVDAALGTHLGEEAIYQMLKFTEGDFAFDPTFKTTSRRIAQSTDAILLEGMRRLDEGLTK